MRLSEYTIDCLKEFVSGDNGLTPGLSGPEILKLFNQIGFKDIYSWSDGGMPGRVSRNTYIVNKLKEINGTNKMKVLFELIFDPRHFSRNTGKDINLAAEKFSPLIKQDGYSLTKIDDKFKIIGADLPEEVEIEIHFEEIQKQILEQIQNSKFIIWVAVAWFTDEALFNALVKKSHEGINIQVIIIDDEINGSYGFKFEEYFECHRVKPTGKYKNLSLN